MSDDSFSASIKVTPKFADRFNLRVYGRTRKPVQRAPEPQQQQQVAAAPLETTTTKQQQEVTEPVVNTPVAAPAQQLEQNQEQVLLNNTNPDFEQCKTC